MRVGERGRQLQGSARLLFPILGFSQLPVRSPTACIWHRRFPGGGGGVEVMLTEATEDYRKAE